MAIPTCHPERIVYARGLCESCYKKEHKLDGKAIERKLYKKWWLEGVKYLPPAAPGVSPDISLGPQLMTTGYLKTLVAAQNGTCLCCGHKGEPSSLILNWNLNTRIVRGLVCKDCHDIMNVRFNSLMFPDDPRRIQEVVYQLESHLKKYQAILKFVLDNK